MHGTPVIIAVEGQKSCLTPGCFGDPAVKGFGESLPGQILTPAADLLSATYGPPVPLPAPLVRLRQVLVNFLSARLFRRPYATWAVRA